ncbi:MAG: 16S rRNA (guanine(966)-N(2))-methyltransferase RsmD [gamma proteobacterium symbiont of Ctena orbiculata]|uniref:Ribosomal RNA small subunit methyltransferase D n=1 Tax=Candidatus Thiodiazotropha taylori TaxID=2792791 RepID=A0A944M8W1_9GAMM|nr:16S rRNA (guanine(966)-N(2))-methyltransferase RsmD [Candidatus Thiodiazotropha taylori]PVV06142.1 MAG: 16S rRNA (guanine(966)-N(2))-methyltransferase RsmD [gamma proteobacterium symbiont of Ctena orbiculata]MBT2988942.1 16S rRNA (guanine(966)-N(2))-methyltransferase RsmD [Candidatus Thiodiazotropha taylori]MBT2996412.1 16S rRNA (guanine(966)-N(2))-methyltransferase RsmD [Candidatus Thiodiazotropha taylori]MBT3000154.1 16S rRNA (guanine(966)-N(2))-methyltransferase RsmD [Candidatus Thiodiazo
MHGQTACQVRIIGGRHRGRRLHFPELPGLRPTGDRIRETLFNWLQPYIEGARCLDLFAGSGALGLEAASRGAAQVVMLDTAVAVVRQLAENKRQLDLDQVQVVRADALQWLEQEATPFDIVFLDPPFVDNLLQPLCQRLSMGWLADGAHIYLEDAVSRNMPPLPEGWEMQKQKSAGQVHYGLACAPLPG